MFPDLPHQESADAVQRDGPDGAPLGSKPQGAQPHGEQHDVPDQADVRLEPDAAD